MAERNQVFERLVRAADRVEGDAGPPRVARLIATIGMSLARAASCRSDRREAARMAPSQTGRSFASMLASTSPDSHVDLVAVCDSDLGRLSAAVAAFDVAGFADHRRLLQEMRPDVVHVCAPHHQHVDIALDCLRRDISVIVENPLARNAADGLRLVEAAERSTAKSSPHFGGCQTAPVADPRAQGVSVGRTWTRRPRLVW